MWYVNLGCFLLDEVIVWIFKRSRFHSFIVLFICRSIFIFSWFCYVRMKRLIKATAMKLFVLNQMAWFSICSAFFRVISNVQSVSVSKIRIFVFKDLLRGQVHLLLLVCKSMTWNFYRSHVLNLVVFVNCKLWLSDIDICRMNLKSFGILDRIWIVN